MPQSVSEGAKAAVSASKRTRHAKGSICTHCRQLKLKCDAASEYPQGCSRCQRGNRQCVVDSEFRRKGHRAYTQSLEQEVQALRELHNTASPGKTPTNAEDHVSHAFEYDNLGSRIDNGVKDVSAQALEGCNLSPEVILTLIEEYFANYHPLFPILQEHSDFLAEYDTNKLLLWTVLAIASCHNGATPDLYSTLIDPVRRLASDLYNPQSRSFKTMQALLLLCVYSFPFAQTINDPSPLYCSLATHIGYQLGLHRPQFRADFNELAGSSITSTSVEKKTWYGCFVVNQGLAMRLGIPATIAPGSAIFHAVTEQASNEIPAYFLLQLNMSLLSYQWLKLLGDDESIASGQHQSPEVLFELFDQQCVQLRRRYAAPWSRVAEISFYALQLQVYSFSLIKSIDSSHHVADSGDNTVEVIQAKTLSTIVRLISEASKPDDRKIYWPFFPKYHILFAATTGIYLASTTSGTTVRLSLLEACKDAVPVIKSWSLYKGDQIARVSEHIANAVRKLESQKTAQAQVLRPLVISRMAANIPYRVIWSAKHGRNPSSNYPINDSQLAPRPTSDPSRAPDPSAAQMQQSDLLDETLAQFDNNMLFEDLHDADFTDMFLDWQSLRESVPEWT